MRFSLAGALGLNAGYVDAAGYLALKGLFTSHVTGNFVTLGAALVLGTSGALAKLLALPVFCAVIVVTRLVALRLEARGLRVLRTMLILQTALLAVAALVAARFGPFGNVNGAPALTVGLTLVSAMAIVNAAQRIHLSKSPPLTIMTGNTTQIMIDLADWLAHQHAQLAPEVRTRIRRMSASVLVFATGCAGGALAYAWIGIWCFCVPVLLASATLMMREALAQAEPHS
ncbi:MAG: rane protein [Gammaproteobacteria bacterium]|nr:rane protein [Gammaproteobacteria bacterium]